MKIKYSMVYDQAPQKYVINNCYQTLRKTITSGIPTLKTMIYISEKETIHIHTYFQ